MPQKTHEQLLQELSQASTQVQVGAQYVHFRNHHRYRILSLATQEATEQVCVVYVQ